MYAKRIDRIQPSATLEMTAKAAELRSQGKNVINLSVGEPDFPTPKNICDAAVYAMENGYTKYTPGSGMLDLRKAVCEKLERDNQLQYLPQNIIVSCGGKHSLYNACQTLFEKNDEVIIFTPYWVSFPDFISVTGATPVIVNTNSQAQYEPDFDDLEKKITSNTKGIIINSPSNPTGGVCSDVAMQRIIDIAQAKDIWLFSDECYEQLVYDSEFKSCASFSDYDKIVTFQSCSKTYSMTGWRLGYGIYPKEIFGYAEKLAINSHSCVNSASQFAGIEALEGDQKPVNDMIIEFNKRRNFLVSELNKIENIQCKQPGGAFYVFPKIKKGNMNSVEISKYLLEKKFIATVPGSSFGKNGEGFLRISYASTFENLEKFIVSLKDFMNE